MRALHQENLYTTRGRLRWPRSAGILLIGALAFACESESPDPVSVTISISMHDSVDDPSSLKSLLGLTEADLLHFTHEDITSIQVDVRDTSDLPVMSNVQMQETNGDWGVTIPYLPSEMQLTFIARAFDGAEEIFVGSTDVTFAASSTANSVVIQLAPVTDGDTYSMPRIASIQYPAEVVAGTNANVMFSVEGPADTEVPYDITAVSGTVPFTPSNGVITLYGLAGQFISIYAAPMVNMETDFTYEVMLVSDDGNTSVKTSFTITVIPAPSGDGATNTNVSVLYNPVIQHLETSRAPGTNDVEWEITVTDDDDPGNLVYQWAFTPGGTFNPSPSLTNNGQTNPVTFQDYTAPVYGTMSVSVTDSDNGVTTLYYTLVANQFPDDPVDPGVVDGLIDIRTGNAHTCVMFSDGSVRCWGAGSSGRLGYGNTSAIGDTEQPYTAGNVPLLEPAVQIDTGASHTCALMGSGFVRCWGLNSYGQLGLAHTESIGDDEALSGIVSLGGVAAKITAGDSHTCALMANGDVRCWGYGGHGRLGHGSSASIGDNEHVSAVGPVNIGGPAIDVQAGGSHTCALRDTGEVFCWGYNGYGQLGYGNTSSVSNPLSAGAVDLDDIPAVQLSLGSVHTCALLETGSMRCWGRNNYGQLGYGHTNTIGDNESPGSNVSIGALVSQISAGHEHTCALINTSELKCWGRNSYGQLGYGDTTNAHAPPADGLDLNGISPYMVAAGANHTCALLSTGAAWCWGYGGNGQLGYGNTNQILSASAGGDIQVVAP